MWLIFVNFKTFNAIQTWKVYFVVFGNVFQLGLLRWLFWGGWLKPSVMLAVGDIEVPSLLLTAVWLTCTLYTVQSTLLTWSQQCDSHVQFTLYKASSFLDCSLCKYFGQSNICFTCKSFEDSNQLYGATTLPYCRSSFKSGPFNVLFLIKHSLKANPCLRKERWPKALTNYQSWFCLPAFLFR